MIALMAGCTQDSSTPVEVEKPMQPKGTITGLINNKATQTPVAGAVFVLGFDGSVQTATSDSSGAFSIANVPVGQYKIVNGNAVFTGQYTLTVSLVSYNISQSDPSKKYRDYYYDTVTIAFTSLAPGDSLAVSDMVGSVRLQISYLNTTVTGQVVDQKMQPVAGAVVTLFDATVSPNVALAQTNTSATGIYQFTHVDNGLTINIKALSSDGSLQGSLPQPITLPLNVVIDSLRSQVAAEQIMLMPADNVSPYVIGITPENNSNVAPGNLQIIYTFSEPIKQTAYTRTDLPIGQNTMIDGMIVTYAGQNNAAGSVPFSAQWNSAFTQLMITPQSVAGSAHYAVDLRTVFNSGNITDLAGNKLVNDTSIVGDFEVLNFSTSGGSAVPAAPALVRRSVQGVYGPLDYSGGIVGLEWKNVANAQSYNLYRSVDNGSFELLHKNVYSLQDTNKIASLCFPATGNNPLSSISVSYQVRSVSADLVESPASNTVTITDEVPPSLLSASVAIGTGSSALHWWNYSLFFSEPLTISNAETVANYAILNPDTVTFTITKADYLGYDAASGRYLVQLLISTDLAVPAGSSISVKNGVTDLAGNAISANAYMITLSAPPRPALSSPNNGDTAVGLPAILSWNAANGATTYRLQVSTNIGFTALGIVFDSNNLSNPINSTSYAVSSAYLTAGITYYWRVSAANNTGTSIFSAIRNFQP
jgi:hypothetical protein